MKTITRRSGSLSFSYGVTDMITGKHPSTVGWNKFASREARAVTHRHVEITLHNDCVDSNGGLSLPARAVSAEQLPVFSRWQSRNRDIANINRGWLELM